MVHGVNQNIASHEKERLRDEPKECLRGRLTKTGIGIKLNYLCSRAIRLAAPITRSLSVIIIVYGILNICSQTSKG